MTDSDRAQRRWPGPKTLYYIHAGFLLFIGVFLLAAPDDWFGPSWSYFPWLPHNGLGMGLTCVALGLLQLCCVARDYVHSEVILMYLGGVVNWTAGVLLFAEGLFGHRGLMEVPWMCAIGGIKFVQSSVLSVEFKHMDDSSAP